ncbi:MAG: transglycosylase domain-containing protein [Bryobacteraceae bacterium]|nr:transglycosylase domain-containing protein [Bryobacteraceae bacterium]
MAFVAGARSPTLAVDTPEPCVDPYLETVVVNEKRAVPRRRLRSLAWTLLALLALAAAAVEMRTSALESLAFARIARDMSFSLEPGPNPDFRHPHSGPYDIRLGHSSLTGCFDRLQRAHFEIETQARTSAPMRRLMDFGLYPVYPEKNQAGLTLLDRYGEALFSGKWPRRAYADFDEIPPILVKTLAYIENREILDSRHPHKNPAVEWDRLARAGAGFWLSRLGLGGPAGGGSTLATQLEKIRHTPGGVTRSAREKARQMVSASLRAYQSGRETRESRERVVRDYLNSVPLAAIRGYGEVHGLGDGLALWYGAGFDEVNAWLRRMESDVIEGRELASIARSYRQALSLLLAIKKPSEYLLSDHDALARRTDQYLDILCRRGIIPSWLRGEALKARLTLRDRAELPATSASFSDRKGVNAVRSELLDLLGVPSLYQLDRLDLTVSTTLDGRAQTEVSRFLQRLQDDAFASQAGLRERRLLEQSDPSRVIYSFSLYERTPEANVLRVLADNYDQPLDINEGTRLELGSTAKLRTLVSYLEAVAALRERLAALPPEQLATLEPPPDDALTLWARDYLVRARDKDLGPMLEAAMNRQYSANPGEAFFTGGGLHVFSNFEPEDNGRILPVREAFHRSVNLVFIRLMRDVVRHAMYQLPDVSAAIFDDSRHPARRRYLDRFVDMESRQFLSRFLKENPDEKADVALERLVARTRPSPRRLAALHRSVFPGAGLDAFQAFVAARFPDAARTPEMSRLYESMAPEKFSLADRAYLAGLHPLELWLLEYKARHPGADARQIMSAGETARRASYEWLFRGKNKHAQDRAIRIMLEAEAFESIHKSWRRLGYPFSRLAPSYASALGSSGDTPAALADLVGVILNDGVRNPAVRVGKLRFAGDTPFETVLRPREGRGERVLAPEVARIVREELFGVVEKGTAVRARRSIVLDGGEVVPVGGKTGTGDNRFERYGRGGAVIESRVVNRTATFVFLIGDRFFGAVTAFVPGEDARGYGFTSSLPVQVFKNLAPTLIPLIERGRPAPTRDS